MVEQHMTRDAVLRAPMMFGDRTTAGDPARRFRVLAGVLRAFALFAVVTGALDMLTGTQPLTAGGAQLPALAATDPVLNSQIAYWGAVWAGFGVVLWWTTRDLRGRTAMLHILLGTVALGGVGRLLAALRFGAGPPMLAGFILIELAGSAAVWTWHHRLLRASGTPSPSQ